MYLTDICFPGKIKLPICVVVANITGCGLFKTSTYYSIEEILPN